MFFNELLVSCFLTLFPISLFLLSLLSFPSMKINRLLGDSRTPINSNACAKQKSRLILIFLNSKLYFTIASRHREHAGPFAINVHWTFIERSILFGCLPLHTFWISTKIKSRSFGFYNEPSLKVVVDIPFLYNYYLNNIFLMICQQIINGSLNNACNC